MLKVPEKYKRCGIKIRCGRCKWQIAESCRLNGKRLPSCPHSDKHQFILKVCIPNSDKRRIKLLETKDFETALNELAKFKEELKKQNYHKNIVEKKERPAQTIVDFTTAYLDTIAGVNTPDFLKRKRSDAYVNESKLVLTRFCISLKKVGYNLETLDVKNIGDDEVGIFHTHLKEVLNLGNTSYNKHFVIMKVFWNWMINIKELSITNPFRHVQLKFVRKEKNIITKEEFDKLLSVVTYENGWDKTKEKTKNHFRDWLPAAFRLALETGLRREELFLLKWSDMVQLDSNTSVLRINNLKVNRIATGEDEGVNIKNVPVTKSLMALFLELGYETKKNTDAYIIERLTGLEVKYMMDVISKSFHHYIRQVTERKIMFSQLRKTYISHLVASLGEKAKIFTGHTSDEVIKNHYLSASFIAGKLTDFEVF